MIKNPPRFPKNKVCKVYYASQVSAYPPKFVMVINSLEKKNFAFTKWLENVIRRAFGFVGVPLVIEFKERDDRHAWHEKGPGFQKRAKSDGDESKESTEYTEDSEEQSDDE